MGAWKHFSWQLFEKASLRTGADASDFHALRVEAVAISEAGNLPMTVRRSPRFTLPALDPVWQVRGHVPHPVLSSGQ